MLALAIYFERRSNCGRDYKTERWNSLVRAFSVDHVYVIDRVDLPCFEPEFSSYEVVDRLQDIRFDGKFIVVDNVCPPNKPFYQLGRFTHPRNACYVIGADALGIPDIDHRFESDFRGEWLTIPTATQHSIWAEQAAGIVLANRYTQHADHRQ